MTKINNPNAVIGKGEPRRIQPTTTVKLVLTVLAVVAITGGGFWVIKSRLSPNKCSPSELQTALQALDANKPQEISSVVTAIKGTSGYARDPNCSYVLTSYYVETGDANKAETSLTQLQQHYIAKTGFKSVIADDEHALNLQQLQTAVAALKTAQSHPFNVQGIGK